MILKTTTNEFCFINVSFYETIADPRYFFEQDYEEMPEYEEELDFDFDSYCNKNQNQNLIPPHIPASLHNLVQRNSEDLLLFHRNLR